MPDSPFAQHNTDTLNKMTDIHTGRVKASNESLWKSQMYSDITVRCGFDEYKLHRAIICPRSTFFAAACKGDFMVSNRRDDSNSKADTDQEAKTATIKLDDDDPETVKRMLTYLYTLDYADGDVPDAPIEHDATVAHDAPAEEVDTEPYRPPQLQRKIPTTTEEETDSGTISEPLQCAEPHDPRMMNNALVYAVAEKYDIPELKELAKHKFQPLACSKWPHNDFHAVTEVVFSTTHDGDMGLRQIVLDICEEHFQAILNHKVRTHRMHSSNLRVQILSRQKFWGSSPLIPLLRLLSYLLILPQRSKADSEMCVGAKGRLSEK